MKRFVKSLNLATNGEAVRPCPLPPRYNLAIDFMMLVIPVLKRASDVPSFMLAFHQHFTTWHQFLRVVRDAEQVFVGVDNFRPRMKRGCGEARSARQHCRQQQQQRQQNRLRLRAVRSVLATAFSAIRPDSVVDAVGSGEGEVKCMRFDGWRDRSLPTVVMSNDNDVLLFMMLRPARRWYRLAGIDRPRFVGQTAMTCRWTLVTWSLALFGSDYVTALRGSSRVLEPGDVIRRLLANDDKNHDEEFHRDAFLRCVESMVEAIPTEESSSSSADNTDRIGCWLVRLYWNVLYLLDLPLRYDGRFDSDDAVPIDLETRVTHVTARDLRDSERNRFAFHRQLMNPGDDVTLVVAERRSVAVGRPDLRVVVEDRSVDQT